MDKRVVWVVEMRVDGKWEPTVGSGITLYQAQRVMEEWKMRNPDDKFRLVKYVPIDAARSKEKEGNRNA